MDSEQVREKIESNFSWYTRPGERSVRLKITPELVDDATAWIRRECTHKRIATRRRYARNNALQLFEFCLDCGMSFGSAISQKNFPNIDEIPIIEVDHKKYIDERETERKNIIETHFIKQNQNENLWYTEYLSSKDWREKCDSVIKRAKGICEGCLSAKAVQVHHLTYRNVGNEFLFELVAICRSCHERYHKEDQD